MVRAVPRIGPLFSASLGLLFASASLGGCLGQGPDQVGPGEGRTLSVVGEGGSIAGVVIDDEAFGVPLVRVEVERIELWTVTDRNGQFRFPFVPPGAHELVAKLRSFEPFRHRVTVEPGQEARVTISVDFPPVTRPHNVTAFHRGYHGCYLNGHTCPGTSSPNTRDLFPLAWTPEVTAIVAEVYWRPNTYPGSLSNMWTEAIYKGLSLGKSGINGPPVVKLELTPMHLDLVQGPGLVLKVRAAESDWNYRQFGFFYEQPFDVYVTTFYQQRPPSAFTAVPR